MATKSEIIVDTVELDSSILVASSSIGQSPEPNETCTSTSSPLKILNKIDNDVAHYNGDKEKNVSLTNGCPFGEKRPHSSTEVVPNGTNFNEWHVLDQFSNNSSKDGSESDSEDSVLSFDEIDALLEEGLPERFRKRKLQKVNSTDDVTTAEPQTYEEREKVVLIEKGHNHFDVLPEGWLQVTHNSGMPLYLHKITRVCTLSKPYFLGPGSARKHKVPLSAIPCLNYRRALETEEETVRSDALPSSSAINTTPRPTELWLPNARIETVQENLQVQSLGADEFRDYCKRVFRFKNIKVMRFKSWSARRKYTKKSRHEKQVNRPTLPDGTKLITFPIQNSENEASGTPQKEWIMNPNGKSYVCILHEYVQHALKKQPSYQFKELENAAMPYSATVAINDMQYGVGYGTSKKQAKSDAAKATLEILIPQMRAKISAESKEGAPTAGRATDHDLSFFDDIKIEDPRVAEFCAKTTEPSPHAILLICLQRNFGLSDMHIEYQGNTLKHQKNEYTMTVGKHKATVVCKNKRDGKQRASQAILQALHPHIHSWGSLLRLYGNRSVKSFREKKQEEQEITQLQSKAAVNSPNYAILNKLRTEMLKLKEKKESIRPLGKFVPEPNEVPNVHVSCSLLNNVDL